MAYLGSSYCCRSPAMSRWPVATRPPVLLPPVVAPLLAPPAPEMGVGPAYAIPKLLDKVGLKKEDIDVFEINEAFASQALYCVRELGLNTDIVNVNGGAIALGHPIGMSGNRLALTLLHELQRRGGGVGAVALCGGGGQGDALIIRVPSA